VPIDDASLVLVGPSMPDRSKVMLKIKKDVLQDGGLGVGYPTS